MSLKSLRAEGFPTWHFLLYALTSAFWGIPAFFLPMYFKSLDFTDAQIGLLLAAAAVASLLSQPFWGLAGDRTRSVNRLFRVLLAGAALSVALYPVSRAFPFLLALGVVHGFVATPGSFLQDVFTLQILERTKQRYGTVRLGATLGFAGFAAVAGWIIDRGFVWLFPALATLALLAIAASTRVPDVPGHQSGGSRVSPIELLKDRRFLILTGFSFVLALGFHYYLAFFPIHYRGLGADGALVGLLQAVTVVAEIPFLLFADRIVGRLGTAWTMLLCGAAMGARWLLVSVVQDRYALLGVNLIHGFTLIVLIYCMATYLNRETRPELRSTAQGLFAFLGVGIPRILAAFLGGLASERFGIPASFRFIGLLTFAAVAVFGALILSGALRGRSSPSNAGGPPAGTSPGWAG